MFLYCTGVDLTVQKAKDMLAPYMIKGHEKLDYKNFVKLMKDIMIWLTIVEPAWEISELVKRCRGFCRHVTQSYIKAGLMITTDYSIENGENAAVDCE